MPIVDPVTGKGIVIGGNVLRRLLGLRRDPVDPFQVARENPVTPSAAQVERAKVEFRALRASRATPSRIEGTPSPPPPEFIEPPPPAIPPEDIDPGLGGGGGQVETPREEPRPGDRPFGGVFPAGLQGPLPAVIAAEELAKISRVIVAAARGGFFGLLGSIFPEKTSEDDVRFPRGSGPVIFEIPPKGARAEDEIRPGAVVLEEIAPDGTRRDTITGQVLPPVPETESIPPVEVSPGALEPDQPLRELKRAERIRTETVPKVGTATRTTPGSAPAPAGGGFSLPGGLLRNLETLLLIEAVRQASQRPKAATITPGTGPEIIIQPPSPTVPPVTPSPAPPPVGSIVPTPSLPGTIAPSLSPAFARQAQRDRTRDKECRVVKRRRRRKRCREGYFVEERGKTTYTTWRVTDCLTGKTIKET